MTEIRYSGDELWNRIERAVEKVKDRLRRVVQALEGANVPYAIVGGNAVQLWVAQVDEAAVRNTKDVDIVLRRTDWEAAKTALEAAGFVYRHTAKIDRFLDGPDAGTRDAVRVIFAGEKALSEYQEPVPEIDQTLVFRGVRTLPLEGLATTALSSYSLNDRVDLRDLMNAGLVDATWLDRVPPTLRDRLQALLDDPDG
ncbi:MAG TPA: hypothetical protein VGN57_21470 [Pirellulaceae bacterium]|jgi:hypothetical protein|nr:hypothetical protein [Pirellulaceae bacterium]